MTKTVLRTTLVFLFKESKVLLGFKKRGFGQGKWNGFGGKLTQGETLKQGACRELKEECDLDVKEKDLVRFALLQFEFSGEDTWIEVNVFKTKHFEGVEKETEEMRPQWFEFSDIPYAKMWADDSIWFPCMFQNKTFWAKFLFQGHSTFSDYELKEMPVEKLDECKIPPPWF